jgi:hypothetical protein
VTDLTPEQLVVLDSMQLDWGTPASETNLVVGDTYVRLSRCGTLAVMRELCALGLVEFGPWFNEDSGLIAGRGYSLNRAGEKVRARWYASLAAPASEHPQTTPQ